MAYPNSGNVGAPAQAAAVLLLSGGQAAPAIGRLAGAHLYRYSNQSPNFQTFKDPNNRFQAINSASLRSPELEFLNDLWGLGTE